MQINRLYIYFILITIYGCSDAQDAVRPNIVVVLADDQGWGDLSAHGNTNLSTPNIDAIAESGAQFEYFYVQPVCSPTRAELLTGRYAARMGVSGTSEGRERMDLSETTIADILKEHDYSTGAFGKWHNGMQFPYHPNGRGFDTYYGFCSGHWGNYFDAQMESNGALVNGEGFIIDDITNKAISFIENNAAAPFFAYIAYNTPHSPMQVPDNWWAKYDTTSLKMRHNDPNREDINHTKAALALCENIDWNVGRIKETLQSIGIYENTIIMYLTDNGPNGNRWNNGFRGKKGSTDEGGRPISIICAVACDD